MRLQVHQKPSLFIWVSCNFRLLIGKILYSGIYSVPLMWKNLKVEQFWSGLRLIKLEHTWFTYTSESNLNRVHDSLCFGSIQLYLSRYFAINLADVHLCSLIHSRSLFTRTNHDFGFILTVSQWIFWEFIYSSLNLEVSTLEDTGDEWWFVKTHSSYRRRPNEVIMIRE